MIGNETTLRFLKSKYEILHVFLNLSSAQYFPFSAPLNMPVEVKVRRKSDHAISVWWRGVSTTAQLEEPLEGYKVSEPGGIR